MLEKPIVKDERIVQCLNESYGLTINAIAFLPLGADINSAVYRANASDGTHYFVKLRCGEWNRSAVTVPNFLAENGINQVIPAIRTKKDGKLWTDLESYMVTVYPFIVGHHGYHQKLSPAQWAEFGGALRRLHTLNYRLKSPDSFPAKIFPTDGAMSLWRSLRIVKTEHSPMHQPLNWQHS